ncbi:MAG: hypothetical protein V4598_18840 [Bdellovibrionota bacterium]
MRIFFILPLILLSTRAWSQACTGATIIAGVAGNVYNCTTLNISPGTYNFPANADFVRVIVTGDVVIASGVILNLRGANGVSDTTETQAGGAGGPGAGEGGGNLTGPQDAQDTPNGGAFGGSDPVCGGGGGGGGFSTAAQAGTPCANSAGGAGGLFYDITIAFRGGFGGAAGGLGDFGAPLSTATGGGGGGAIWISAGGNFTNNGSINVRGGNGGNGIVKSGGGGGGSGGAIRLEATGQLINNGIFTLNGGTGGPGNAPGARGGNGAAGLYELIDLDNVIEGTGTGAVGLSGGNEETFRSSISCGAVKMKDENLFFQMMAGFMLVVLISRIRGLIRRSI